MCHQPSESGRSASTTEMGKEAEKQNGLIHLPLAKAGGKTFADFGKE